MYDDVYAVYDDYYAPRRRTRRRYCGGAAAATGHCGATDCKTCYPGSRYEEEEEEEED